MQVNTVFSLCIFIRLFFPSLLEMAHLKLEMFQNVQIQIPCLLCRHFSLITLLPSISPFLLFLLSILSCTVPLSLRKCYSFDTFLPKNGGSWMLTKRLNSEVSSIFNFLPWPTAVSHVGLASWLPRCPRHAEWCQQAG